MSFDDFEQGPELFIEVPKRIDHLGDGRSIAHSNVFTSHNAGPEEVREPCANANGISPDDVIINSYDGKPYDGVENSRPKSRTSVSFSRWNASWDPRKQSDPNMN